MGGVLSHVLIGLISGGIIYFIWRKPEFFLATLVGNTIVDFFKFFFTAIKQGTYKLFAVDTTDTTFIFWSGLTNSLTVWFTLGFFLISLTLFLYHHHKIREKTMYEYDEVIWAFLFGVVLHIILDLIYQEPSIWL